MSTTDERPRLPTRCLYLVNIETHRPVAIFSIDHLRYAGEIIAWEARLRAEHHVDDPASGLALRDSRANRNGPTRSRPVPR